MSNCIKFPINKTYFYSLFILTIGLFLFATYFLIFGKPTAKDIPPMVSFDILYLLVIILYIRKYIIIASNNLTALELNENEIIDYISNVNVKWSNVSDIRFKKIGNGCYISVYVNDKKEVIRQSKNVFKRISLYINILITGTPVRIFPTYIRGKNVDIFDKIYEYFKKINFNANIGWGNNESSVFLSNIYKAA